MSTFYLKSSDTLPILEVALKNPDGTAFDLTGVTTTLRIRVSNGDRLARAMVTFGTATNGITRYTFLATDWGFGKLPYPSGQHAMEYECSAGAGLLTFPNKDYDTLEVTDQLG